MSFDRDNVSKRFQSRFVAVWRNGNEVNNNNNNNNDDDDTTIYKAP